VLERDIDSGSWLNYLTPVTAVVLAAALYMVVRAEAPIDGGGRVASSRPAASAAAATRLLPPSQTILTGPIRPYVLVLVSTSEEIEEARQTLSYPKDAYLDIRVAPPRGQDRQITLAISEIITHRNSHGLPEPIVMDLRPPATAGR
jgi:hypothetical protein